MNKYDFDKKIDREQTASVKYDLRGTYFGKADVLPMWVADMDFETPDFIRKAVTERAEHPVYGYSFRPESYFTTFTEWVRKRHNWPVEQSWVLFSPGIVPALNMATLAYTSPGNSILVQPPVYFPFFNAVNNHKRVLLENVLIRNDGKYVIDFDDFEQKAANARMFFLSNPHNPVGRAWSAEELEKMGEICLKNDVLIISDEIHGDLMLPGHTHIPMASLSDKIAACTITCMAPSKTFNMAGLATSSVIISDRQLRVRFERVIEDLHIGNGNFFGTVASEAAYREGEVWLDELMQYIDENFKLVDHFLKTELPVLKLVPAEATYLAWIDFRGTGLQDEKIKEKLIYEAGLGFSHGPLFGKGGEGFQRMNLATPKANVVEALEKLKQTFG
jgi:cystathionine beta-lyase